jgi:hypothetical protein
LRPAGLPGNEDVFLLHNEGWGRNTEELALQLLASIARIHHESITKI